MKKILLLAITFLVSDHVKNTEVYVCEYIGKNYVCNEISNPAKEEVNFFTGKEVHDEYYEDYPEQ